MTARKPAAKPRPSGPTQPEDERRAKQVLLRLVPADVRRVEQLARRLDVTKSEAVARAVRAMLERVP